MVVDHRSRASPAPSRVCTASTSASLVLEWIDPDCRNVGAGESDHFKAHERHLLDERQVPGDEVSYL